MYARPAAKTVNTPYKWMILLRSKISHEKFNSSESHATTPDQSLGLPPSNPSQEPHRQSMWIDVIALPCAQHLHLPSRRTAASGMSTGTEGGPSQATWSKNNAEQATDKRKKKKKKSVVFRTRACMKNGRRYSWRPSTRTRKH